MAVHKSVLAVAALLLLVAGASAAAVAKDKPKQVLKLPQPAFCKGNSLPYSECGEWETRRRGTLRRPRKAAYAFRQCLTSIATACDPLNRHAAAPARVQQPRPGVGPPHRCGWWATSL